MGLLEQASLVITPNAVKTGKLYSAIPTDGTGDLDVVRATSATRVNSAGLIETVGNNIARLDYTNGSCPSILVEPQRTNLVLMSNSLNTSPWSILLSEVSIDQNFTTSPDGTNNANRINFLTGNTRFTQIFTVTENTTYTISFWIKNIDATSISINIGNTNLGTLDYFSQISSTEWTRVSFTFTTNAGVTSISPQITRNGTIGRKVLIYGVQLEAGSNATSYIPTTSATVTRNADVIRNVNAIDLIGQTEGTLYWEGNLSTNAMTIASLRTDSGILNGVIFDIQTDNRIKAYIVENNSQKSLVSGLSAITFNSFIKIAYVYKSGNCSLFINGVKQNTNTQTFTFNNTLSRLNVDFLGYNYGPVQGKTKYVKSVLVFPTQLTDAQCISLTTL